MRKTYVASFLTAMAVLAAELTLAATYYVLLTWGHSHVRVSLGVVPRTLVAAGAGSAVALLAPVPPAAALVLAAVVYAAASGGLGLIPPEVRASLRSKPTRSAGRRSIPPERAVATIAERGA